MIIDSGYIKKGNNVIFPITNAESVLIIDNNTLTTLPTVLDKKIESTPENSGLIITGKSISHSNIITAQEEVSPVIIAFNSTGHIVKAEPVKSFNIIIENKKAEYDGSLEQTLKFGDDFKYENELKLTWNDGIT